MADLELLTIKMQQMTIESTNDNIPTAPASTYSECYAQVFSRLFLGDCLVESDKIESGSVDLILTDLPYGTMDGQSKTGIYHNGQEKHEWDSIIDTDKIMEVANRILRYRDWETDRKSTRLNSSHITRSRMPSSA